MMYRILIVAFIVGMLLALASRFTRGNDAPSSEILQRMDTLQAAVEAIPKSVQQTNNVTIPPQQSPTNLEDRRVRDILTAQGYLPHELHRTVGSDRQQER